MATFVFDSSALVKRYLDERGSEWVRRTLLPSSAHTVFVAQTTPVELIAAITRRQRSGALPNGRQIPRCSKQKSGIGIVDRGRLCRG